MHAEIIIIPLNARGGKEPRNGQGTGDRVRKSEGFLNPSSKKCKRPSTNGQAKITLSLFCFFLRVSLARVCPSISLDDDVEDARPDPPRAFRAKGESSNARRVSFFRSSSSSPPLLTAFLSIIIKKKLHWTKQNLPFYRIFVADSRSPRDGKHIEVVGHYDPVPGRESRAIISKQKRED